MTTRRCTFSLLARGTFTLGTLSWLALSPNPAFAQYSLSYLGSFDSTTGAYPQSGVTFDSSGNLFGTTGGTGSGANGNGTLYEIPVGSSTLTHLASFTGANGSFPRSGLTLGSSGDFYGTTVSGGTGGYGTVYKFSPTTGLISTLASFSSSNGNSPESGVSFDTLGNLYGTTVGGGLGSKGTVYKIAVGTTTITTLASFSGANGDAPTGFTLDSDGNLFGTTVFGGAYGGAFGFGTVYEIDKSTGSLTTLASFNGAGDGRNPNGLTLDADGNLYGTTSNTVFKIAKNTNIIQTIAAFDGANGSSPLSGVTFDSAGNLYGTTSEGGSSSTPQFSGTVYKIAKGSSTITDIASFDGTYGYGPVGGITLDSQGNLYGTTQNGGGQAAGTVFKLTPNGSASAAPEPAQAATFGLILVGLAGVFVRARRRAGTVTKAV